MSSLVPSPLVRGQSSCSCAKGYDLWFQGFAANAHVWSRETGREGYGVTRNGGIVGINTSLGDKTAGGIVFGFSNPYFYDSLEKVDLNDYQFGLHIESQLGNDWETAFFVGGGAQQGDAFRNALHNGNWFNYRGDYRGNTLSATLTLSKVLRIGKRTALRPTIGIDSENAWLFKFTEDAAQSVDDRTFDGWVPHHLARREFYRSHYDRTMARIGIMGQTGGDTWGFNGRVFYSPQIGGPTVASTPMSLVEGSAAGAMYNMKALPLGREFITIGLGGHTFLNKKRTVILFGDYNANLFARATTQIASLGTQVSF